MSETAQNPKVLIITALITAVTTILVAFVAIFPQLRGNDREAIKTLQDNVNALTQKLAVINPREDPAAAQKKMSVTGTVYTSASQVATLGGMDVYLLPEDYRLTGHTDDIGHFSVSDVPVGQYSIILRDPSRGNSGKVLLDDPREEISVMGKWVKYHIQK
jgi:hypothetical protein